MQYFTIDKFILIISIIIGLIKSNKLNKTYLNYLPLILLTILLFEISIKLIHKPGENNILFYNIISVIEFTFFLYFFQEVIPFHKTKIIIKILKISIPIICFVNIVFIQGIHTFHTITYIFTALILIIIGVLFFYQTFKKTEIVKLQNESSFWITTAIIFFYTSSISIMGIINYAAILPKLIIIQMHNVLISVNCFFYLMLIFAFTCQINTRKSTRNS